MYRLKVTDGFASAHQLKGYQGKCEDLHGHNWKVEVMVRGEVLDSVGLLIDFKDLKKILRRIIDQLDHKFLNDIMDDINPSSELIAKHIHAEIKPCLPPAVSLESVAVWESDNSCAIYSE